MSQLGNLHRCVYSEGVVSHSPGLPRFAATLGHGCETDLYPNGVPSLFVRNKRNPFRVDRRSQLEPRVAAMRSNPGLCDETPSE